MSHLPCKRILMVAAASLLCSACVSSGSVAGGAKSTDIDANSFAQSGQFGHGYAVRSTIGTVKTQGSQDRLSSRAIRLPEQPLGEITAFAFQYPSQCGGHEFHVYEADGMQILEYNYAASDGGSHDIRDYIAGPSPFVQPGLWTAYDHTADSISTMTPHYEKRGDRMFNGVYSQGLITNLPSFDQKSLGKAYQQALSDAFACRDI